MHEGVQNAKAKCIFTTICNSYLGSPIYKHRCYVSTYEWKTFFQTTVSIPPLLGQPHQIQPYGSPRAGRWEFADDHRQWWWVGLRARVGDLCSRRQKLTLKMTTSDRRRNSQNYFTQKNLRFWRDGRSKWRNDETPVRNEKMIVYGPDLFLNDDSVDESTVSSKFRRFVVCRFVVSSFCDGDRRTK